MKTVVTHDGTFHADDTMAIAICKLVLYDFNLIRTRDETIIKKADYVFDVGNVYNPIEHKFDHHMKNCPTRMYQGHEIPYSSAGFAWKHFGKRVIPLIVKKLYTKQEILRIFNRVDKQLFIPIDLVDNGIKPPLNTFTISNIIGNMNTTWNSLLDSNTQFDLAVKLCESVLINNIISIAAEIDAVNNIKYQIYNNQDSLIYNNQVLVLNNKLPYVHAVYALNLDDVKFVIIPENDNYLINTIPFNDSPTGSRLLFPEEWSGLRNEDLEKVTGIPGSLFCHVNLFIAGATSFASAKNMIKLVL